MKQVVTDIIKRVNKSAAFPNESSLSRLHKVPTLIPRKYRDVSLDGFNHVSEIRLVECFQGRFYDHIVPDLEENISPS